MDEDKVADVEVLFSTIGNLTGLENLDATIGTGAAAGNPTLFVMAFEAQYHGDQFPQGSTIVNGLIKDSYAHAQCGALLAADSGIVLSKDNLRQVEKQMVQIVEESPLSAVQRMKAGRVLSQLGDPRDLEALTEVEAGQFSMDSRTHPNSQPEGFVSVEAFRIGIYPVVNRYYLAFIEDTGRHWRSGDGRAGDEQNLGPRWPAKGKIKLDECLRLPTEVEWERASRGDLKGASEGDPVWPWGTVWRTDTANFEETGSTSLAL
ncbi:hypothetical protein BDV96DRAFT_681240 [Lophiotrema nucula]|uniref:Sulfatase-modifying factor enzyme-like domain-containing protein n=1 Tax=Lophiotrema nucula TaxID=690887 RepID=A0A6A5ZWC8_9PLEO|nr:hypothetical protein BDV96DRAFT_681240 [Lophiotrema nucula]